MAKSDVNARSAIKMLRFAAFALALATPALTGVTSSAAIAGETKAADEKKPPTEAAKDAARKIDEIAEAGKLVQGPAGQPECVWTGRRIVGLLWRDDLDTAARHRDLYERFGCPAPHIQAAFRCVVKQGELDPKAPEALNERVHACWVNTELEPPSAAALAVEGAAPAPAPQ